MLRIRSYYFEVAIVLCVRIYWERALLRIRWYSIIKLMAAGTDTVTCPHTDEKFAIGEVRLFRIHIYSRHSHLCLCL